MTVEFGMLISFVVGIAAGATLAFIFYAQGFKAGRIVATNDDAPLIGTPYHPIIEQEETE